MTNLARNPIPLAYLVLGQQVHQFPYPGPNFPLVTPTAAHLALSLNQVNLGLAAGVLVD